MRSEIQKAESQTSLTMGTPTRFPVRQRRHATFGSVFGDRRTESTFSSPPQAKKMNCSSWYSGDFSSPPSHSLLTHVWRGAVFWEDIKAIVITTLSHLFLRNFMLNFCQSAQQSLHFCATSRRNLMSTDRGLTGWWDPGTRNNCIGHLDSVKETANSLNLLKLKVMG